MTTHLEAANNLITALQSRCTELVEENNKLREYLTQAHAVTQRAFNHADAAFERAERYAAELREKQ